MSGHGTRLERLEKAVGKREARYFSVFFTTTPEKARRGDPNAEGGMWGSGDGTWIVYKAPAQSQEDALMAAGIDTEKDRLIIWNAVGP